MPILTVPGFGPLTGTCEAEKGEPVAYFGFTDTSPSRLVAANFFPGGSDGVVLAPGEASAIGGVPGEANFQMDLLDPERPDPIATLDLSFVSNGTPTACARGAQATISG